jgi:porphobilinogen deaminase
MIQNTGHKPLTLGVLRTAWHKLFGVRTQAKLLEQGIESNVQYFGSLNAIYNALLSDEIEAMPYPFKDLPTYLPTGILPTALTQRRTVYQAVVSLKSNDKTDTNIIGISEDAKIVVKSAVNAAQLRAFLPQAHIAVETLTPPDVVSALRQQKFDAAVLTSESIAALALQNDEWDVFLFSPREFIPEVGQGVVCFVTAADNLPIRRLFQTIHTPSVSVLTNVERTLKKRFPDGQVNAYCDRDRMGHYHLWVAALVNGTLRRTRISQTTSYEMAERAYEKLFY